MSELKIEKLISGMTPAERTEFGNVIFSGKRERAKILWKTLLEHTGSAEELDKARLYPIVFEREYQKSDDYLLRNEIRLLRQELFDFLIIAQARRDTQAREASAGLLLLRALLERELFHEFEFQYKSLMKKARKVLDHHHLYEMSRLYFYYVMQHREIKPEVLEELRTILQENLESAKSHYRTRVAINQQCQTVINAIPELGKSPVEPLQVGLDQDFSASPDPVVQYFEAMAQGNQSSGMEKVKWGEAAVSSATLIQKGHPEKKLDALATLALAHFFVRNYPAAKEQFEKAQQFSRKLKRPLRIEVLYNYCSTLMKLEEYDQVISLIEERKEEIQANPRVRYAFEILHCFCFVFKREPKKAREALPQQIRTRATNNYQYIRFILCILPGLREDYEDGLRETSNFITYFNRNKKNNPFGQEKEIAILFKRYYMIRLNVPSVREQSLHFEGLREDILIFVEAHPTYRDYLYLKWLLMEIGEAGE
jgi:tetratricopeptide (TPR) repeat protein